MSFYFNSIGYEAYDRYDINEMSNCKMVEHILVTSYSSDIKCGNDQCDQIKANISESGLK